MLHDNVNTDLNARNNENANNKHFRDKMLIWYVPQATFLHISPWLGMIKQILFLCDRLPFQLGIIQ